MAIFFDSTINPLNFFASLQGEYTIYRPMGSGGFGTVVSARHIRSGIPCAIKYIPFLRRDGSALDPRTLRLLVKRTLREIRLLRFLSGALQGRDINPVSRMPLASLHILRPQFLNLLDVVFTHTGDGLFVVTELGQADLCNALRGTLGMEVRQWFMIEILMSFVFMHSADIVHRDFKPQNVLVNYNPFDIKVCDFGGSRSIHNAPWTLGQVCTPHYESPELICQTGDYTDKIDMWSVGCVFAELLRLTQGTLFHPRSQRSIDRLDAIVEQLGNIDGIWVRVFPPDQVRKRDPDLADHLEGLRPYDPAPGTLGHLFAENEERDMPDQGIHLLSLLLRVDPAERLPAAEAIQHPYFCTFPESKQVADYQARAPFQHPVGVPPSGTVLRQMMLQEVQEIHAQSILHTIAPLVQVQPPPEPVLEAGPADTDPFDLTPLDEENEEQWGF